jgi:subtilase family serine protease
VNKTLFALLAGVSLALPASAQTPVFLQTNQPYVPLSGPGVTNIDFASIDEDEGYQIVPIQFPFPWFGQTYNQLFIHTNGVAVLGGAPSNCTGGGPSGYCSLFFSSTNIPNTASPNNILAPFFDDLDVTAGVVRYASSASELTVEWSNIEPYSFSGPAFTVSFQLKLTAAGSVVFHYGPRTGSGGTASVGFESPTGALGASVAATGGGSSCTSLNQAGCCSFTTSACTLNDVPQGTVITIGEPNEADLGVQSVTLSNLQIAGDGNLSFDVQAQLRNYGKTAAPDFLWRAFISTDRVLDAADQQVAEGGPVSLGVTSATSVSAAAATTTAPAQGAYYVLVQVDPTNVVMEAAESNNVGSTFDTFVSGLDLVATSISGVASTGGGNVDPIAVNFYNRGTTSPGPVTFRILLSTDTTVSAGDFLVFTGTRSVSGGQTITETINVTMPLAAPSGDFYYLLEIDPGNLLMESSKTNNAVASSSRVQVRRADIVAEGADFLDPLTGLSTRTGKFGEAARGTVRMSNQGGANATGFSVAMVLSTDATLSLLSDTIVCEQVVPTLPAGVMAQTATLNCPLPLNGRGGAALQTGQYFIFLVTDSTGAIYESNKGNNNLSVGPIRITAPGADLAVASLTAPAAAGVGEVLPVVRTLRNLGNRDAPAAAYRYYASANEIITTDDIELQIIDGAPAAPVAERSVTLTAGAADSATELVRLPGTLPPGTYYLGCIIDPGATVAELDRANNAGSSRPMQVAASSLRILTTQVPDATVGRPFQYRLATAGEQGASTWRFDVAQGAAPDWLALDSASGTLSGTPTGAGGAQVVAFTVVLENAGRVAAGRLAMRVLPPTGQVEITTGVLPSVVNSSSSNYSFSLGVAGGVRPYAWRVAGGALPSGLALSADGVLSGRPQSGVPNGPRAVIFEVTDATGGRARKELNVRLVAPGSIVFRTLSVSDGLMGQDYLQDIAVENADGSPLAKPLTWSLTGALPDGLTLTQQSELVTVAGRPLASGTFTFGVGVQDANGRSESLEYTMVVFPPRFKISVPVLPDALRPGEEVNVVLTVSASGSVAWKTVSGALPPGLTLSADGRLSGNVAAEGSEGLWTSVVEARDATGTTGLAPLALRVEREPAKTGCSATGGGLSPIWLALLGILGLRRRWTLRVPREAAGLSLALTLVLAPALASAQTYQVVGPTTINFQALGTGGLPAGQNLTAGATVALPFDFPFYTATVNTVAMSSYGYLAVGGGSTTDWSNETVPHSSTSSSAPRAFIAPWWDDMTTTSATYKFAVTGAAPNRVAIFEWFNTAPFGATTPRITYQALLYEGSGRIRFAYGSTVPGSSSASIGIQGDSGNGVPGLTCSGSASCSSSSYPASSAIDFFLPPDLTIASLSVPQIGYAGVALPLTASVRNRGGRDATAVDVRFYLSADAALDAGDQVISTQTVGSISVGATVQVTSNTPLPAGAMPGNYFVLARVDPDGTLLEQDETNNNATPVAMTIGAPKPDLVVSSFSSPTMGAPGAMVALNRSFQNLGNAPSSAAKYTYFVSDNSVVSISDRALTPVGQLPVLAPQAVNMATDMVALPADLPAGRFWLGVCVNYDASTSAFGTGEITIVNNCATGPQVQVSTTQLTITTTSLPTATQYAPYGLRLGAAGGTGEYAWVLASGSTLPPGLTLSAAGDLTGAPATTGTFSFEVKVTSGTLNQSASLSLTVAQGNLPLVIVDQTLPAAEFGRAYSTPLIAVGGKPPYQWATMSGAQLPEGFALSSDGTIEGRGTAAGDFTFAVRVTDSAGTTASKELALRVVTPTALSIATAALETGFVGREYLQPLVAVGGRSPYAWTLLRLQQLPENPTEEASRPIESSPPGSPIEFPVDFGISIEDGFLRGAPKKAGLYVLTFRVTDGTGTEDTATVMLYVTYRDGLAITTTLLPDGFINSQYAARLSHNGGRDAEGITFSPVCVKQAVRPGEFVCAATDGKQALPQGLVLSADGSITGVPTGPEGVYSFLVKLTDAGGRQDVRGMSIRVRPDFTLENTRGCSGTGLDPSTLALLGAAAALLRRRARR